LKNIKFCFFNIILLKYIVVFKLKNSIYQKIKNIQKNKKNYNFKIVIFLNNKMFYYIFIIIITASTTKATPIIINIEDKIVDTFEFEEFVAVG